MKEIHFYLDYTYKLPIDKITVTYDRTKNQIRKGEDIIHTTSIANISFDLLDLGYRIFVHKNDKVLECKLGNMDGTDKEIRRPHNILKMIMAGVFDEYFNE